ncbi:hypothetical protein E2C01_046596 [Portunus trituberculatus]|uniref:Uncharacterized protein n=1 Tax=Portunus trituberculatus TaxID=210409 RepID=A0A5B7FYA7_PORTR|nr:hypothetical protein [Portunus trituberculatus]
MFPHLRHIRNIERVHQRHIRRVMKDRSNPFEAMTEEEFLSRFRLTKECTLLLIGRIENRLPCALNNRILHNYAIMHRVPEPDDEVAYAQGNPEQEDHIEEQGRANKKIEQNAKKDNTYFPLKFSDTFLSCCTVLGGPKEDALK